MPELPEVQTIADDLRGELVGRRFVDVEIRWDRSIATPDPMELRRQLCGRVIEGLDRRGKYLLLRLSGSYVLIAHLRMTGSLILAPDVDERFARVIFTLDDGRYLTFRDIRKFGRLWLVPDESTVLSELGPEPLSAEFSQDELVRGLHRHHSAIKPLLLDQRFIAGMGNIYVDEALYQAGLHPLRKSSSVTKEEAARLYRAIRTVLERGIRNRGTSLRDYVDAFGREGRNQEDLRIFRRAGESCPRCRRRIERMVVAQRGTFYCPECQPMGERT